MTTGMEATVDALAALDSGQPRVLILLPVYDGAQFLAAQLDSLLAQSFSNFHVLCRDDGSRDASPAILQQYCERYPGRFTILPSNGNLGASGSFSFLMEQAMSMVRQAAPGECHMALCDQDDSWHQERLARGVRAMVAAEREFGAATPLVVHSDLRVVDEDGDEIAASFMRYQGLNPERRRLADQALSNTLTGCTCLLNPALVSRALPVPVEAIMHDWWLALTASAFGRIVYLDEALVDYRQHGANTIGAREFRPNTGSRSLLARALDESNAQEFLQIATQCQAFLHRHAGVLSGSQRFRLGLIARLFRRSVLIRKLAFRLLRRV